MNHEISASEKVKPDPNTLWSSPFDNSTSCPNHIQMRTSTKEENAIMEDRQRNSPDRSIVVKSLVNDVKKFWTKHEVAFVEFWNTLSPTSRENFLWCVYPTLPYSLSERYCYENGVKIVSQRYDNYLLLNGRMTISNMSEGNNLVEMMRTCAEPEYLKFQSSEIVTTFRQLHQRGVYPSSREEKKKYNRELNLKKGDYMYSNSTEENFGQYIRINNPHTLIHGSGTLGPDGHPISLYRWGLFAHPTEHNFFMEYIFFELSLMVNAIDEYKEEILGKDSTDILVTKTSSCANCDSYESKLLACGGCKVTYYCSKVRNFVCVTYASFLFLCAGLSAVSLEIWSQNQVQGVLSTERH